eukprot:391606_1
MIYQEQYFRPLSLKKQICSIIRLFFIGDEAIGRALALHLPFYFSFPDTELVHAFLHNKLKERIWNYIFNHGLSYINYMGECRAWSDSHSVLLTEAPLTSKQDREKSIKIMFETFDVPNYYSCNKATLSLYAYGKLT